MNDVSPPRIYMYYTSSLFPFLFPHCNHAGAPYNRDCHHKPPVSIDGMATVQAHKKKLFTYIVVIVGPASETAFPRSLVNVDSGSD